MYNSLCFLFVGRFRQIEVLTTVANAFSSLYSQVSGTPLQRIGSMSSVTSNKETDSPPPLTRSNTANRLMKTLSKLNLCVDKTEKGEGSSPSPATEKGKIPNVSVMEESGNKNDQKSQKIVKKKDSSSMLATVKEEVSGSSVAVMENADIDRPCDEANSFNQKTESEQSKETQSYANKLGEESGIIESDLGNNFNMSRHNEPENGNEVKSVHVSTPEKEPCAPLTIPSIRNIMAQQKDSFEMEEVGKMLLRPVSNNELGKKKCRKDVYKRKVANRFILEGNHPNFDFSGFSSVFQEPGIGHRTMHRQGSVTVHKLLSVLCHSLIIPEL